jgi:hypothetical protein
MMRIEQNRANAQHSTGPNSEEGKAISSRNATRHGLTGKKVVINGEDQEAYESLRKDLLDSYRPANAAEAMLVDEIAQGFWRLQRARALEAEQFNLCCGGADPIIGFNSGNADFERLRRYMTSIERAYHRAIEQLEKTQASRKKEQPQPTPPTEPPQANKLGFVSQNKVLAPIHQTQQPTRSHDRSSLQRQGVGVLHHTQQRNHDWRSLQREGVESPNRKQVECIRLAKAA